MKGRWIDRIVLAACVVGASIAGTRLALSSIHSGPTPNHQWLAFVAGTGPEAQAECIGWAAGFGYPSYYCNYVADGYWQAGWLNTGGSPSQFKAANFFFAMRSSAPPDDSDSDSCPANRARPTMTGNPVDFTTGAKYLTEVDYQGGGDFAFRIVRHYTTQTWGKTIGRYWQFGFEDLVDLNTNSNRLEVRRASGNVLLFSTSDGINYTADDPDVTWRAERLYNGASPDGWQLTDDADRVERYGNDGRLLSRTTRGGLGQSFSYNGAMTTITDDFGKGLSITRDANDRITLITTPDGGEYRYAYTSYGHLEYVSYPDDTPGASGSNPFGEDNPYRRYHYHGYWRHLLTGITDENGVQFATYVYDSQKRVTSTTHAGDADKVTINYAWLNHASDPRVTVTNALGKQTIYHLQDSNSLRVVDYAEGLASANCAGANQDYSYDADGFVDGITDWNGNVTALTSDARGLINSRTEALGTPEVRTVTTDWHPDFRRPALITEPGRTTAFSYDTDGNLLTRTVTDTATGASRTWSWTYNQYGQVLTEDGPRTDVSDVTTYTYHVCATGAECGQLATVTNALGHVTQYTAYDANGRPTTIIDPNNVTTSLTYTARGWLDTSTVDGLSTDYDHDAVGQVILITTPEGRQMSMEYDAAHRLTAVEDGLGNRIEYTLDKLGNRTATKIYDPLQVLRRSQSAVFDELGRLIRQLGAASQTTEYAYDPNGNRTLVSDPNDNATGYAYDALNRLITQTDALDNDTAFGYDDRDNLTSVTDARNNTTSYTYDGFDDKLTQVSPDTGTTTYSYDEAGNLAAKTDARGITASYAYDAMNRLSSISYPDTSLDVTYAYDQGIHGTGRLTAMGDNTGSYSYAYDARGNRTSQTWVSGGQTYVTGYAYDDDNHLVQITYPSGRTVDYSRDGAGRITAVSTTLGSTATLASGIAYAPFGAIESLTYGNGLVRTQVLDQDFRIDSIQTGSIQSLDYGYDLAGNITAIADLVTSANSQTFGYDALDRLTSAAGNYGSLSYAYDALGNRLSKTEGVQTETYTYAATSNRLLSVDATAYTYDGAGNPTAIGDRTLVYDDRNRMASVADPGGTLGEYTYNALGQRTAKTVSGATTVFHYDQQGNLIAETDTQGTTLREYVYLDGQRLAIVEGGAFYYLHTDHLDTPNTVTDGSQTVVWDATHRPFGEVAIATEVITQNLRFPGQYFDGETSLTYNYFRDYAPSTGRYVQSDPAGMRDHANTYGYARANPTNYFDSRGLAAQWILDLIVEMGCNAANQHLQERRQQWEDDAYAVFEQRTDRRDADLRRSLRRCADITCPSAREACRQAAFDRWNRAFERDLRNLDRTLGRNPYDITLVCPPMLPPRP